MFIIQGIAIFHIFRNFRKTMKWWKWYDKHDWFGKEKDKEEGWLIRERSLEMFDLEIYLKYGPCRDPKKGYMKTCWEIKKRLGK